MGTHEVRRYTYFEFFASLLAFWRYVRNGDRKFEWAIFGFFLIPTLNQCGV
jgi:hypothetical protein